MTLAKLLLSTGAIALSTNVGAAEIRISAAYLAGNALIIRGATELPNQIIILDGRYKRRSNTHGRFEFRLPYRPRFCAVDLVSGGNTTTTDVKNCNTYIRRLPPPKNR